jgi:ATP-dependent phosphoenolpyruvate carboxykinase
VIRQCVEGLDNIDDVLESFASSCYNAGSNCALNSFKPNSVLNFTRPSALLSAIDNILDSLYARPVPIFDLPVPATVTASNVRGLLFRAMYSITKWPQLAEDLAAAFNGNFTSIVNATMQKVNVASVQKPDDSTFSTNVIFVSLSLIFMALLS